MTTALQCLGNQYMEVIEGPAYGRDLSYRFVEQLSEVREIEQGIPYRSFEDLSKRRNLDLEFKLLKKMTETAQHSSRLVPNGPEMQGQNRYSDIVPYTDTAVVVSEGAYINASYVSRLIDQGQVIATQGPLPATRERFWLMIWEQNVTSIVMISALNEAGKAKCDQYFPTSSPLQVGSFSVVTVEERQEFDNLTLRRIAVEKQGAPVRNVLHYQFTGWPDHGSPDLEEEWPALMRLLDTLHEERSRGQSIVVHCSAGIGRTGTIIALHELVSSLHTQLSRSSGNIRVSVFATVRRLREERWGMVQNRDQYSFIYKFLSRYIAEELPLAGAFIG